MCSQITNKNNIFLINASRNKYRRRLLKTVELNVALIYPMTVLLLLTCCALILYLVCREGRALKLFSCGTLVAVTVLVVRAVSSALARRRPYRIHAFIHLALTWCKPVHLCVQLEDRVEKSCGKDNICDVDGARHTQHLDCVLRGAH